jgi:hypothetical protein
MDTDKMLDIALEMRQWLVRQNIDEIEAEIICGLCADRIKCERYYKTYDLDKVEMRIKR